MRQGYAKEGEAKKRLRLCKGRALGRVAQAQAQAQAQECFTSA